VVSNFEVLKRGIGSFVFVLREFMSK